MRWRLNAESWKPEDWQQLHRLVGFLVIGLIAGALLIGLFFGVAYGVQALASGAIIGAVVGPSFGGIWWVYKLGGSGAAALLSRTQPKSSDRPNHS
ncbi:hypothetical protein QIS99_28775 [Streptomyces sp. B-S-A8]|uniref:Uncharacterized protein n=1 Tax=Streptomyces solicavernae TaxID=3043614 RepID=A0ABT6S0D5_9ACTN|nr:hypothetical protein [Streptomyces sp. B-S-A8]MDI3390155.1 hypothetical protein [Streptomyces sp. B-S-A8]